MNTHHHFNHSNSPFSIGLFVSLVCLLLLITACSFNVTPADTSASKTDVARSVEATLNAEKVATFQAQQTLDGSKAIVTQPENPNSNATLQAQQATLDAQATALAAQATQPASSGGSEATPSLAPAGSLDPIQILDWKMTFWLNPTSGCESVKPCWITNDDYVKHSGGNLLLTSQESYLIDPSWPNPYLAYRQKRDNRDTTTVTLIVDGNSIIVKTYPKGVAYWTNDAIALSDYKGKEIKVQFMSPGRPEAGGGNPASWGNTSSAGGTHWFVANIQIFPNYKP